MPKQARKKPQGLDKAAIFLSKEISKYQDFEAMTDEEVAAKLSMGKRTYSDKLKEPWRFTVGELAILIRMLKIPNEIVSEWQKIIVS